MVVLVMCTSLAFAMVGCKKKEGKDDKKGAAGEAGKAGGGAEKLTKSALEELLKESIPGFEQQPGPKVMEMAGIAMVTAYYKGTKGNDKDMTAFAQVRMFGCGHCPDLTAASFKEEQGLFERLMLSTVHKDNMAVIFDVGEDNIAGKKVVTIYQLSFHVSEDGKSKSSSHAFSIYHHNGKNMLHVMITPRAVSGFKSADSLDELKALFTRDEMKAAATTFMESLGAKVF